MISKTTKTFFILLSLLLLNLNLTPLLFQANNLTANAEQIISTGEVRSLNDTIIMNNKAVVIDTLNTLKEQVITENKTLPRTGSNNDFVFLLILLLTISLFTYKKLKQEDYD